MLLVIGIGIGIGVRCGLAAAADPPRADPPPAARCEIAIVSPVSGHAECVKPAGAKVDPPPPRPPPTEQECLDHPDVPVDECKQAPPDPKQNP
jgi:hypothetical protein